MDKKLKCYREKEASEILGIPRNTLRTWRRRGKGPNFIKEDSSKGIVLYRECDLIEWQEKRLKEND